MYPLTLFSHLIELQCIYDLAVLIQIKSIFAQNYTIQVRVVCTFDCQMGYIMLLIHFQTRQSKGRLYPRSCFLKNI